MRKFVIILCLLIFVESAPGRDINTVPQTRVMTLAVFHFAYPDLDAVKTEEKDKISVLEEPYQSEIIAVANSIMEFNPTIIAVEALPGRQKNIDSLYSSYRSGEFILEKNEIYQLGFRIGKKLDLPVIYCVDDWGRQYDNIAEMFNDSIRIAKFEDYYFHSPDSLYQLSVESGKVTSIIEELYNLNNPDRIRERLSGYLLNPFKYEESPGDFTGVDFETGRWFNRNLRIFRNIQRIQYTADDRILLIIGREHLNLLNLFFEVSREFDLVSPLPYLERAGY